MDYLWIGLGVVMLVGSAATMNSRTASPSDHDFAMILFFGAIGVIFYGVGIIDADSIKTLIN